MLSATDKIEFIQGDCLEVLKSLPDRSYDYGFTSPPYNRLRNDKYAMYTDKIDDYFQFLCAFTDELLRICKRAVFINVQKTMYNSEDVFRWCGKYASKIRQEFIWEKSNPMPASGYNVTNAYESFFYLSDTPPKSNGTYTKNVLTTAVNGDMPPEHKAVMKQEVADYYIGTFFERGTTVLDCFGGLGTTAIACRRHGLGCTSIELVPEYIEMAKKRLSGDVMQMTLPF